MHKNPELELAFDFVKKTDRTIFLTGKAGTGKTTFLHAIKAESLKRSVVVAPTGVAAINAKGVTIHSFFQMPFGPILPEEAQTQHTKASFQRKFNRTKIDIIRSLDLLIIDEISMVRADLLDGIDQVLRRYKNRNQVFGGVQVLMIGDLQQLSPVVKENEWALLKPYYATPYFFSSKAFQQCNAISIELKHIYRQDNEKFIKILNEIRNNKLSQKSADELNTRYLPNFSPAKDEGYITLTTHNNRATAMNTTELQKITSKSYFYKAVVEGKFPEYAFPTHEKLELKKGAQVMFIKNDSSLEKRYFNGKIGSIVSLDKDEVIVHCPDDEFDIVTTSETWENVSYSINQETKAISENVTGSFVQVPLRLAWAITIHKSQGLTFEKAIIDAQASFAHGQTYVALSRCRTLEGIVLKSAINQSSIINDTRVTSFNKNVEENTPNTEILNESQKIFQLNLIKELFDYYAFLYPVKRLIDLFYTNKSSIKGNIIDPLLHIKDEGITKLLQIGSGFSAQLRELSTKVQAPEKDAMVQERIKKALTYFIEYTENHIKSPLKDLNFSTENKAVDKDIKKQLQLLQELLSYKLYCLNGLKEGFSTAIYLALRAKAILQKSTTPSVKKEYSTTTEHPILFSALRGLRGVFAEENDVEHYQIFTQKSLYEMCEILPTTTKQLRAINGMGKVRVQKYGAEILEAIQRYCDTNAIEPKEDVAEKKTPKKGETHLLSFQLFKEGLSVAEIATKRGLVNGTIEAHLIKFVVTGELEITDLMPEEKYLELKKIMLETKYENTNDLKRKIDDKFTYNEIRMVGKALNS
ncbi:MAG: helix-turn-helix domain-containing protein [Flavobacteriaceae bacterium]